MGYFNVPPLGWFIYMTALHSIESPYTFLVEYMLYSIFNLAYLF